MLRWQWVLSQLIISGLVVQCKEYLGCFRDSEERLMTGYLQNFVLTLTPDRCVNVCTSKGFKYAGVKSRISCFCNQEAPATRYQGEESLCHASCVGDEDMICGGDNALSVYSTSLLKKEEMVAETLADSFVGCYEDNSNKRLLAGHSQKSSMNSPDMCKTICYKKGYLYAGVEYGVECFCGDSHPPPVMRRNKSQCSMVCPGDPDSKCGGGSRISVYETGITDIPVEGKKLGCFDDEDPRVLDGFKIDLESTNSPRRCMNLCRTLGYSYSGVEYGVECFCGNTVKANSTRDSSDHECNTTCPGDAFETCGANWELLVYRTEVSDHKPVIKKVGCYTASGPMPLKGFRKDFTQSKTPDTCAKLCFNKGFLYSTLTNSKKCWCDNEEPFQSLAVLDEDCNEEVHSVVYQTGYVIPSAEEEKHYIGCFRDATNKGLGGVFQKFTKHLTPENCARQCFNKGYLYSGTKNKDECHCGDKQLSESRTKVADEECSSLCSGDKNKNCGGSGKISVYTTGITDISPEGKLIGCFVDETAPRVLNQHKTDLVHTNSPRRCLNYCRRLGFSFSGVEFEKECFCGDSRPSSTLNAPDSLCNSVCSGDNSQTCGGGWRMAVYRTDHTTSTTDSSEQESVFNQDRDCELSETLVNGKAVCQGAVVFKDTFTTSSLAGHWQHEVKIADDPDYEFVTFTSDIANSFHQHGNLVIKPTILTEKEVREGSTSLEGCTGLEGTRECELEAFSYNILPPVHSARINTRRSFTFRYGVVEIRARLPKGDWLVPELWLLPKDQSYGSNYLSGKVRIAMSRGNRYLTCNGEDLGSPVLVSGILVGADENVTARSIVNRMSGSWHAHSHNYTVVWTPDNLSFYVDGQSQQALLPPGVRLSELLGPNTNDAQIWSTGSRIAPFDTDFYLSLGLSAGGMRDFPDNCVNRDQRKPWNNFKVKAMLKFWLDKDNWLPTWEEDKSSLIVEHVQVTAL